MAALLIGCHGRRDARAHDVKVGAGQAQAHGAVLARRNHAGLRAAFCSVLFCFLLSVALSDSAFCFFTILLFSFFSASHGSLFLASFSFVVFLCGRRRPFSCVRCVLRLVCSIHVLIVRSAGRGKRGFADAPRVACHASVPARRSDCQAVCTRARSACP